MSELIDRQAALNCVYGTSPNKIKGRIAELPSAQPVNIAKLQPNCNQVASDCIGRQAAIDALGERPVVWSDNDDYTLGKRNQYDMDRLAIETVLSAQPELSPCDVCRYYPPSSMDGKPCTICPAERENNE